MSKTKKKTIYGEKQCTSKKTVSKKRRKLVVKFDIKKKLKERCAERKLLKQSAESDEEMIVNNDLYQLYQENENQTINFEDNNKLPLKLINLNHIVSDRSNYNIPFNDNSNADSTESCTQRFKIMSIEENEFVANIHFNHLMKANWSPEFNVSFENNKFYSYYLVINNYDVNFLSKDYHY